MSRVRDAFAAVPRKAFLPAAQQKYAHQDVPLDIGHGVTNSQPTTVLNMLSLLSVEPGHRVLDVGAGSAWTTALLAHLVGEDGEVVGVERIPEVLELGRSNLGARYPWASLRLALPDQLGWPAGAPYDRILVSADARSIPWDLVDQLTPDGIAVLPVKGEMTRLIQEHGKVTIQEHGRYSFVPLIV